MRRLRARFADLEIVVGCWGDAATSADSEPLIALGASEVVCTLAELRDRILGSAPRDNKTKAAPAPLPA